MNALSKKGKKPFLVHGTKDVAKLIFIRLLKMIIFLWANQRYHIAHSLLLTFYVFFEEEEDDHALETTENFKTE